MEGRIFLPLLIGLCLLNGQGTFAASPSPPATSSAPTTVTTTPDAATTITSVATSTEESSTATPATSTIDVTTPTTMKPTPAATSPSPATTTELVTTPSSATSVTAGQGATQPTATTAGPMETDTTTANDTAAENPTATPTNTTSASPEMPSAGTSTSSTVQPTTGNLISSVSSTEPLTTETSASTVRSTAPPTSTSDFCSIVPCEADAATCINIKKERICRCPYGYYYDSKICSQGKQFFVTVKLSKTYSPEVVEPGSAAYKELYQDVHDVFGNCFNNQSGYEQTIITKISYSSNTKRFWKSAPGSTVIEVINIFRSSSSIEEEDVFKAIKIAVDGDPLLFNATRSNPCNSSYCDEATTHCEPLQNGTFVNCTCKDGFYTKTPELRTCKDCAPDCSKTNFKECVQINGGSGLVPSCQCLADYQFNKEKKTCVLCDFGYSGKDCKDNFLLILVIVGVVLGALLLGLLGAVIGLSVKSKRNSKTPDRERLIDHEENPVFGSGTSTNGSLFPKVRAKPTVNANVATMNPYTSDETFQRSVPTRDYDDDNDSWYEMSQKDNRYGNQSKY